ncbi:Protein of unknown function DUF2081 [Desulfonatronospira thiodismutans ASO3-1]|uniref:GmrSD restriction endonucleases N-terminal domain-containing protein n=1 Tax=Desulfonatronospira thiodismutans ASO3-1 TaxID=555779 RepID=D6SPW8_9BACT|nr:DUF262 domain-containing protein [Desulfonatronospira thiodismutans]EFI34794.1 Protein of unknown function DUF2081 [Desulfonatronospira thiodismutans ASO3-1]
MTAITNTFSTDQPFLSELLSAASSGSIQLPDFQRGWVWDDNRIKAIIASVSLGYPVGALMCMETGGEGVRFSPRPFEGVSISNTSPSELMLDGQQRITSLFLSLKSQFPVLTTNEKKQEIKRYYYLDIKKCFDPDIDRFDAIVSVPEEKVVTSDFGRKVDLDLSSTDKEIENEIFPLNIIFDGNKSDEWQMRFQEYYDFDKEKIKFLFRFKSEVITPFQKFKIPVIKLLKDTPKEAVCQVFENVNTGGVSLTVFELLTATFAADDFRLRQDWDKRRAVFDSTDPVLKHLDEKDFLTAVTLLSSYNKHISKGSSISCKRKDILNLTLSDYCSCADDLQQGMIRAAKFLHTQKIFDTKNLPYQTQLIPLSVICSILGNGFENSAARNKLSQWFWCGVLGELYGGANETRYALDVQNVPAWINGGSEPVTVRDAGFYPTRLLSLQTRNSAAYKGIMALLMKAGSIDLINGDPIETTTYFDQAVDIHHIFPRSYCIKQQYERRFWNSIINKAPLTSRTNRIVGGKAPSSYMASIVKNHGISSHNLHNHIETHLINPALLEVDDFTGFISDRAKKLLDLIQAAIGKSVTGRDSQEVVQEFGGHLQ